MRLGISPAIVKINCEDLEDGLIIICRFKYLFDPQHLAFNVKLIPNLFNCVKLVFNLFNLASKLVIAVKCWMENVDLSNGFFFYNEKCLT